MHIVVVISYQIIVWIVCENMVTRDGGLLVQYKGSVSCSESLNSFSVYKKLQNYEKSNDFKGV